MNSRLPVVTLIPHQDSSNFYLQIVQSIITEYLDSFSVGDTAVNTGFSSLRSLRFEFLYEREFEFSESHQGKILTEKDNKIPLITDDTIIEKTTKEVYGFSDSQVPEILRIASSSHPKIETDTSLSKKSIIKRSKKYDQLFQDINPYGIEICQISTRNLEDEFYMEAPSLILDETFDFEAPSLLLCFFSLPHRISADTGVLLFRNFCCEFPKKTNRVLFGTCYEESVTWKKFTELVLKTYLFLALSNKTVFKAILLWSAFNLTESSSCLPDLTDYLYFKSALHAEVIEDLNHRLKYKSSVCCDHTMAIISILLEIENFNEVVAPKYWFKLTTAIVKIISLRGGFGELCKNNTGYFFAKVFSFHYFTGFGYNLHKHDINHLNIEDLHSLYKLSATSLHNSYYRCMKDICAIVGETLHLHSLMKVAKNCSEINRIDPNYNYDQVNHHNLASVAQNAKQLESRLSEIVVPEEMVPNMMIKWDSMKKVTNFVKESTFLLINQIVYCTLPIATLTLIHINKIIPLLIEIFDIYFSEDDPIEITLILPLFLVGCDIVGDHYRSWYIENLRKLYDLKKEKKILTIMTLIDKIWKMNDNGHKLVSWPDIAEEEGLVLPLYV